jgi:hypothetical protein
MVNSSVYKLKDKGVKILVVVLLSLLAVGFLDNQIMAKKKTAKKETVILNTEEKKDFEFWTLVFTDDKITDDFYVKEFKKYKKIGFDAILLHNGVSYNFLKRIAPLAKDEDLELRIWASLKDSSKDGVVERYDIMAISNEKLMDRNSIGEIYDEWGNSVVFYSIDSDFDRKKTDSLKYDDWFNINNIHRIHKESNKKLYPPNLSPKELEENILFANRNTANGISIFLGPILSKEQLKTVSRVKEKLSKKLN